MRSTASPACLQRPPGRRAGTTARLLGPLLLLAAAALLSPARAEAQAFCALRDPTAQIYAFFQEASAYRSVVRTIESHVFRQVSERLGFGLHRSELGSHTVYVAMAGDAPLGLVHVRSERSRWGLVEVAWALDTELRVIDFAIQRCRSSLCAKVEDEAFRSLLRGRGLTELRELLTEDGRSLDPALEPVPERARRLAAAVIRNGLKTIVVTEAAWGDLTQRSRPMPADQRETPPASPERSELEK